MLATQKPVPDFFYMFQNPALKGLQDVALGQEPTSKANPQRYPPYRRVAVEHYAQDDEVSLKTEGRHTNIILLCRLKHGIDLQYQLDST